MLIRRLNIGRGLVVFVVVEEVVDVEVVKDAVVVVSQMIKVKIECVGERLDPVVKLVQICVRGLRSVKETSEIVLAR